jgi:RNA recognition motif-containing protein
MSKSDKKSKKSKKESKQVEKAVEPPASSDDDASTSSSPPPATVTTPTTTTTTDSAPPAALAAAFGAFAPVAASLVSTKKGGLKAKKPLKEDKSEKKRKRDEARGEEEEDDDDDVDSDESDDESSDEEESSDDEEAAKRRAEAATAKADAAAARERKERTLFVGNMPPTCTRADLRRAFSSFGPIETVFLRGIIPSNPKVPTRVSKRVVTSDKQKAIIGYVVYKEIESVAKAISMDGSKALGPTHTLRVDSDGSPRRLDPSRTLFVGNISGQADEESLRTLFESSGAVSAVRLVRDGFSQMPKGVGFVEFESRYAARDALVEKQGARYLGRELRVERYGMRDGKHGKGGRKFTKRTGRSATFKRRRTTTTGGKGKGGGGGGKAAQPRRAKPSRR